MVGHKNIGINFNFKSIYSTNAKLNGAKDGVSDSDRKPLRLSAAP